MHPSNAGADPAKVARAAVMNGVPIPAQVQAQLEARGVDVGALEIRIRQTMEFKR